MAVTYEAIATTTLGSSTSEITFSSIPQTYTDLRVIYCPRPAGSSSYAAMRLNNDTGTNYGMQYMTGQGTSRLAQRNNAQSFFYLINSGALVTNQSASIIIDIFNYTNTNMQKSILVQSGIGITMVEKSVGAYTAGFSAVTTVNLRLNTGNLASDSTATLYGILKG